MEANITNYYHPKFSDKLEISRTNINTKGRRKFLGPKDDETLDAIMPFGVADAAKVNSIYWLLIQNLGITSKSNEELIQYVLSFTENKHNYNNLLMKYDESFRREDEISTEQKLRFMKLLLHHNWSIKSIWWKLNIQVHQVPAILRWI